MMKTYNKLFNIDNPLVIAVDGVAASGKGTFCELFSKNYNLYHCQTSIFYRGLAYISLKHEENNIANIVNLATNINIANIDQSFFYEEKVTKQASYLAQIPEVREALNKPQIEILKLHKRIIMEGRDIGTVIAPNADLKLYFTAELITRAQRRWLQLSAAGKDISIEEVTNSLQERDLRDTSRSAAPLKIAEDAIIVDTTKLDIKDVINYVLEKIKDKN